SAFHDLSGAVHLILKRLIPNSFEHEIVRDDRFAYCLEIKLNGSPVARLGQTDPKLSRKLGIRQNIYFADLDWDLIKDISNNSIIFREVPKFPEVRRDLSLVIGKNIPFEDIQDLAYRKAPGFLKDIRIFDVYEGDKIDSDKKAYALSFILQDPNKTLEDKVIDRAMNKLMSAFESELNALIRK
ncbi:MAG: phenylalanine--tRNA ligase subunit beta, partial [Cyclobacteriaceae bacterium]